MRMRLFQENSFDDFPGMVRASGGIKRELGSPKILHQEVELPKRKK